MWWAVLKPGSQLIQFSGASRSNDFDSAILEVDRVAVQIQDLRLAPGGFTKPYPLHFSPDPESPAGAH
jgi:hypothetical protein